MPKQAKLNKELPLSEKEVSAKFDFEPKAKIPKELRSMLIPELESYELKPLDTEKMDDDESEPTVPNIPEWFGASPAPIRAKLPRPPSLVLNGKEVTPLTVFGAEDRRIYNDTRYPWGTICKVVTSAGTGSGVIVGPRHVLTASHVVDWSRNGAGTVEVHRSGGSVSASTAIRRVWYYTRITGRNIPSNQLDEDYAVLVTSERIGDLFGWMGTKTYSSSWDNKPFWYNIGYPASFSSAMRPTFQRDQKLDEPWYDLGPARSMSTQADLTPGNSGGPMFAFWSDGPYVVAVVSAESSSQNWCSGGRWLTKLVRKARQEDA